MNSKERGYGMGEQPFTEDKNKQERAIEFFKAMHGFGKRWGMFVPNSPLNRSDLMVLSRICMFEKQGKKVKASELAEQMDQSSAAISQKIRQLEEKGLVKRISDKSDRRITLIEPTQKGSATAEKQMGDFFGKLANILEDFGEENTSQTMNLLRTLSVTVEKEISSVPQQKEVCS